MNVVSFVGGGVAVFAFETIGRRLKEIRKSSEERNQAMDREWRECFKGDASSKACAQAREAVDRAIHGRG